jgi:recombination protein RecA
MAKKEMTELDKDLKAALDLITKQFGSEALMTCDDASIKKVDVISTGSLNLDVALGVGGLPEGRINTIYGEASSGKSTIALQLVANAQKKGYLCAYLDSEHAVDLGYAKALGVDLKHLLFAQPESGTACFSIAEALLKQGKVKLIIFDSVSTMLSDSEILCESIE